MKALITGASSGIGRDIARILAQRGYGLILCARREDRLKELRQELQTDVRIVTADLSRENECMRLYEETRDERVDILVNNAGFGVFGAFGETDLLAELSMLSVNIDAVHILTKLFLRDFVHRGSGHILNVASSAAFMPGPLFSSYYASKAYVLRLTQAVREELRQAGSRVRISALCPGPVDTEFNETAGVRFSVVGLSSPYVAEYAVRKMLAGKTVIVPGAMMKCVHFFSKLLPDSVMAKMALWIQKRKQS